LVYSVGDNRKDEHGSFDEKHYSKGSDDDFGTGAWDVKLRGQPPLAEDEAAREPIP
jgi:hypothetical protein